MLSIPLSISILYTEYTKLAPVIVTVSVFIQCLHLLRTDFCQSHPRHWICGTFDNLLRLLPVSCTLMLLWSTVKEFALGFLILPAGVKAWSLIKSHSLYSCFSSSLKCFFTTASSTCGCEVTPPPRYDHKVCVHPIIVALLFGVNGPLNTSKTSIPCFLRHALGPLFNTTNNQSSILSVGTQPLQLAPDNNSSWHLLLSHCFVI